MTWMAGEYSAAQREKKMLIPVLESALGKSHLAPAARKPLDTYHKRFGCQILITWKSFDQPHEDMMDAPTFSLSLSLFQGQLNSFFSASSFFISGSSLIAAHMQKRQTVSRWEAYLWGQNEGDITIRVTVIELQSESPPLPSYNSGAETCKRISVGTSSTHWILKRCQVQTLSLNAVTQPSTDTSGINVHGNATEHSQCELPTCGQIEIHLYRALSQTSLSKTHSHEQGNLDRTYNTWPNHAPIDTPSPG